MRIAIIYTSSTGNTEEVATVIHSLLGGELFVIEKFPLTTLLDYDAVVIGTYTWGNGEIPSEVHPLYEAFEKQHTQEIITAVFGTGDRFYPHFCGAVDLFRDRLAIQSVLAVTLKIEQFPQNSDIKKCAMFVDRIRAKLAKKEKIVVP